MLIIGNVDCLRSYRTMEPTSDLVVLNYSSLAEGYPMLNLLPRERFNIDDSQQFDIAYANYITADNYRFIELMKIVYPLYEGRVVFILVSRTEFYDILNESLSKFIQQRYGYISNEVYSIEDLTGLRDGNFSIQGLYNLDHDKELFVKLAVTQNMISVED